MTEAPHYNVALVEDNIETLQRLQRMVDQHPRLKVVAHAATLAEGRKIIKSVPIDVLLVDLGLPDGSGIELISETVKHQPSTDIMVVTVFGDERNVIQAIEAGASGYLLKDGGNEYIADSILQLIHGGSPISPSIARHLLMRFKQQTVQAEDAPTLTPRELDVLQLISKGFRYDEISDTLSISIHTVTSHIKKLYRKLAVHSRGEAVFEATRLGIVR